MHLASVMQPAALLGVGEQLVSYRQHIASIHPIPCHLMSICVPANRTRSTAPNCSRYTENEGTPMKHRGFMSGPLLISMPHSSDTQDSNSAWVLFILLRHCDHDINLSVAQEILGYRARSPPMSFGLVRAVVRWASPILAISSRTGTATRRRCMPMNVSPMSIPA